MLAKIFATDPTDRVQLWLRLVLGAILFPHGAQKALGWFGGSGFSATLGFFRDSLGIPAFLAILAILVEFLGALALLAGFATRIAAFGIAVIMAVAVMLVHRGNGFFMNWFGQQPGEGYEYHLLVIGLAAVLMARGGGAFSVDANLVDK
jgi:putative oxidoreductase